MTDKKEKFEKAFREFNEIGEGEEHVFPDTDEWMSLFAKFHQVMKQGDGLMWSDIEKIVNDVIWHG